MDLAVKRLELAEKRLKAVESNHVSEALQRAALIEPAQKEIKSARSRLEESRKYLEKLKLRGNVLGIRGRSTVVTRKLREHKILLEWMERQRRVITSKSATSAQDTESHSKRSQGKKAESRQLRTRLDLNCPGPPNRRREVVIKASDRKLAQFSVPFCRESFQISRK